MQRENRFGLLFTITEQEDRSLLIECNGKSIVLSVPWAQLSQSWYNWQVKGDFVQDAFSYLNPDEREFLITGMTGAEFDALMMEESDE